MTDEQFQQALDKIDQRLAYIVAILQQIADGLTKQRDELRAELNAEIAAVTALPRQFQRGLPSDAAREYLAGRWHRTDGNVYRQPPPPLPVSPSVQPQAPDEHHPPGPIRPPGIRRD